MFDCGSSPETSLQRDHTYSMTHTSWPLSQVKLRRPEAAPSLSRGVKLKNKWS